MSDFGPPISDYDISRYLKSLVPKFDFSKKSDYDLRSEVEMLDLMDSTYLWGLYHQYVSLHTSRVVQNRMTLTFGGSDHTSTSVPEKQEFGRTLMTPGQFLEYFAIVLHRRSENGQSLDHAQIIDDLADPNVTYDNHPAMKRGMMNIYMNPEDRTLPDMCNWKLW